MKSDFSFLEDLGFDEVHIFELNNILTDETKNLILMSKDTVIDNIKYLKDLGISNYQDAFLKVYNMFLMEPSAFDDIFSKYDREDLILKLEKNIAILEHL